MDRVAIVTGDASGIGRASVRALAEAGAAVLMADLDEARAGTVVESIREAGGRAFAQRVDVAEEALVREMIDAARHRFGGIDILHNNAAASAPTSSGATARSWISTGRSGTARWR